MGGARLWLRQGGDPAALPELPPDRVVSSVLGFFRCSLEPGSVDLVRRMVAGACLSASSSLCTFLCVRNASYVCSLLPVRKLD